ncbi:Saccharopine dehydrogenase-like oxidoreductase [Hypsibius exemplaris]|uniref:Saccharopine dehydrogenase-like oxidoreductase n=1 Tax=Hypsibius exemplaris TaxID=2072580 RepID=A0A1W0XBX2_HYPEX|nr:Saccharopine dehydrogenase-like oxidoreductase [Hypsibius exemplaris]
MMGPTERKAVVIFGATGFTGEWVVRAAIKKQQQESNFTFAIAGRSIPKLKDVLNRAKKINGLEEFDVEIIQADVKDEESIRKMCQRGTVLINCVGPYRFYGEQIVKACIEANTHYVDISGEPHFLESMQVKYDELAKSRGVYIVSACGFDSIPSELGIAFVKKEFPGDLNSVETYLTILPGPEGAACHYTTWESAVHGVAGAHELGPVRKQLYKTRLPRADHKVDQKNLHFSEEVGGYSIPFPGADRSVARRTEYYEFLEQKKRPVQVVSYFNVGSLVNAAKVMFVGAVFMLFAKFEATRKLLLNYPGFFSAGVFTHEGPTDKQIAGTRFEMKLVGHGYLEKTHSVDEVHSDLPTQTIVAQVTGPEPGYAATSAFVLESAFTILQEVEQPRPKIPRHGVLTPGYAFQNTNIYQRLAPYGIKFEVLARPANSD